MSERPDITPRELRELQQTGKEDYVAAKEQQVSSESPTEQPGKYSVGESGLGPISAAVKRAENSPNGDSRIEIIEKRLEQIAEVKRQNRVSAGLPPEVTLLEKIFGEATSPQQLEDFRKELANW